MERIFKMTFLMGVLCIMPVLLLSGDFMAQGNALFEKEKTNLESYKEAGDIFVKVLEANLNSYEAAWKAARPYWEFANESKKRNTSDWKGVCKEYGKLGMKYGEKAIALNGNGVEGNCWYGFSVGNYSNSVSILTALREGLKDKTQSSFEKAYQVNKMYYDGGPIKALGRFWFVLPWPLQDKKLSFKYLREFQKSFSNDPEGQVFLAEALMNSGSKDEAKALLQKASTSGDKYYIGEAKRLLAEM